MAGMFGTSAFLGSSVSPILIAVSWSNTPESILFLVIVLRGALLNRKEFLIESSCILLILYHRVCLYKGFSQSPVQKVANISVSQSSHSPPNNSTFSNPQSSH